MFLRRGWRSFDPSGISRASTIPTRGPSPACSLEFGSPELPSPRPAASLRSSIRRAGSFHFQVWPWTFHGRSTGQARRHRATGAGSNGESGTACWCSVRSGEANERVTEDACTRASFRRAPRPGIQMTRGAFRVSVRCGWKVQGWIIRPDGPQDAESAG